MPCLIKRSMKLFEAHLSSALIFCSNKLIKARIKYSVNQAAKSSESPK